MEIIIYFTEIIIYLTGKLLDRMSSIDELFWFIDFTTFLILQPEEIWKLDSNP